MLQVKKYLNSKEFLISFLILFILILINMIPKLRYGYYFLDFQDCFAFWHTNLTIGYAQYLQIILPLIVLINSLKDFFYKMSGSYLKNALLKVSIHRIMFKEILCSYLKGFFPLFLIIVFVFLIGRFLYPDILAAPRGDIEYLYLEGLITSPYFYVLLSFICRFLFIASITNIGLAFVYCIKKFYVSVLSSFVFFHLLNFLVQFLIQTISYIIGGDILQQKLSYLSLMIGYTCGSNILIALFTMIVFFLFTSLVIYNLYFNKIQVVSNFEE